MTTSALSRRSMTGSQGKMMWYFTWILGLGLALAFGIINVMWLETSYFVGELDEEHVHERFTHGGPPPVA
jgi:cytochrome bd-I ubiquinol oxidase subunit X